MVIAQTSYKKSEKSQLILYSDHSPENWLKFVISIIKYNFFRIYLFKIFELGKFLIRNLEIFMTPITIL